MNTRDAGALTGNYLNALDGLERDTRSYHDHGVYEEVRLDDESEFQGESETNQTKQMEQDYVRLDPASIERPHTPPVYQRFAETYPL